MKYTDDEYSCYTMLQRIDFHIGPSYAETQEVITRSTNPIILSSLFRRNILHRTTLVLHTC